MIVKLVLKAVIVVATVALAVIAGALAAIRWQIEPALTGVRKLNRVLTNRGALRAAGTDASGTAVVVHRGRRSGRTFRTPVHLDRVGNSFVIALAYGDRADWVRNVVANGGAVIELGGETSIAANPVDRAQRRGARPAAAPPAPRDHDVRGGEVPAARHRHPLTRV